MPQPPATTTTTTTTTTTGSEIIMSKPQETENLKDHAHVLSYEYGLRIKTGDSTWLPFRFISAIDPKVSPVELDGATYFDEGSPHPVNVGETVEVSFFVQAFRNKTTGKDLPEVEALRAATKPDAVGAAAQVTVQYFDKPTGGRKANPDEAYEIDATVSMERAQTGNGEIAGWNVTLKGVGKRRKVANPASES